VIAAGLAGIAEATEELVGILAQIVDQSGGPSLPLGAEYHRELGGALGHGLQVLAKRFGDSLAVSIGTVCQVTNVVGHNWSGEILRHRPQIF
jgi:hypothetical protein